jgi:hypothetical protein
MSKRKLTELAIDGVSCIVCQHQRDAIDGQISRGLWLGERFRPKLTDAVAQQLGITMFVAEDASPERKAQWAHTVVRYLFWDEGTRCRRCGHEATGALTEYSDEQADQWERDAEAMEEEEELT